MLHSPSPKAASPATRRREIVPVSFRRFFNAMMVARQRQVEREIARYLRTHRFSDETEREIERRFLSAPPHI
jgi:hypothetical protein